MIYCVEDERNIRELIVYTLETSGFEARGFSDGAQFFKGMEEKKPDLILLDIMLPGEDGMEILKKLKRNSDTDHIPVIMVTAKGAEYDKVLGLDTGADDYIAKPFGMMEFVARVKAVLRRSNKAIQQSGREYTAGKLKVQVDQHRVMVDDNPVALTLKEFEVLRYLLKNRGIVLTRNQLLEHIWGYDFDGETRTVDVHIRTLRQKLGEAGEMIETVRGVGYRIGGNQ